MKKGVRNMLEPASIRTEIPDSEENRKKCHCPVCPSYPNHGNDEHLYCGTDASKCDIEAQGCLCDTCTIYYEYELKGVYYCNQIQAGESKNFIRKRKSDEDISYYQTMVDIREESIGHQSQIVSMGSLKKLPFSLDDIFSSRHR